MIVPRQPVRDLPAQDHTTVKSLRRMLLRNRWILIVVPLVTLIATVIFVRWATPVYEARSKLRLDQERAGLAALQALQELSTGSEIQTEMHQLRTAHLAEQVVDSMDLNAAVVQPKRVPRSVLFKEFEATRDAAAETYVLERVGPDRYRLTSEGGSREVAIGQPVSLAGLSFVLAPAAARHEKIELRVREFPIAVQGYLRELVVARPDREASVLHLEYESTDRVLAAAVPNTHAALFIANRNAVRKTQANSTVDFLVAQIDTLGAQLSLTESGMLAFRERERVINPMVEGEAQVSQLASWQAERDALDAERRSLAGVLSDIEQDPNNREPNIYRRLLFVPSLLKNPAVSELIRSLNEQENRRTALREQRMDVDPDVVIVTERIRELDTQLKTLGMTYLRGLDNTIASMDVVLGRYADRLKTIPAKEMQLARQMRTQKVTADLYTALQVRLKEAQVAAAIDDNSVRVMDPATLPLKPIRPNLPLSVALALILGTALAAGIAFVREQLDSTIRSRDELQEMSGVVPVLGQVPRFAGAERRGWLPDLMPTNGSSRRPAARIDQRSPVHGAVAEAYRTLRTNIAFTQPDRAAKLLVITSAQPGEGKSTSASNLALTLAQQGLRVLLIDADLRRGRLHETLNTVSDPGLSNVLLGSMSLDDVLQTLTIDGAVLRFIPTGTRPPNPAELLGSPRAPQLFAELRASFDAIMIDTPPLNLVTDAAIIGAQADGVLLLARSGVTDRESYRHAINQLNAVHARILGCILNDVDTSDSYYGRKGAAEYYTAARPGPSRL